MERFRKDVGEYVVLEGILVGAEPKEVQGAETSCTIQLLNLDLNAGIVLWGRRKETLAEWIGKPIRLEVKVKLWRDSVQLSWSEPSQIRLLDVDVEQYVPVSGRHYEDIYRLNSLLEMLDADRVCSKITKQLFAACYDLFLVAPAARAIHHNYKGGLLEHTVEVASLVLGVLETHKSLGLQYLDESLVVCGALLHDFGKVREYGFENFSPCVTLEGKANSHLFLGATMIYQMAAELGVPATHPDVMKLVNIVQSHHGSKEFGNLADPMTFEAEVVSHCDSMSASGQVLSRVKEKAGDSGALIEEYVRGRKLTILI